jgi:hypothetical protein
MPTHRRESRRRTNREGHILVTSASRYRCLELLPDNPGRSDRISSHISFSVRISRGEPLITLGSRATWSSSNARDTRHIELMSPKLHMSHVSSKRSWKLWVLRKYWGPIGTQDFRAARIFRGNALIVPSYYFGTLPARLRNSTKAGFHDVKPGFHVPVARRTGGSSGALALG